MENASKALIIAGAILISILIISFGVIILGQGGDVIKNANMSDAEIVAYNGKFEAYEGTAVRGSNVKQLIKITYQHNIQNKNDSSKQVLIKLGNTEIVKTGATPTKDDSGILSGKTYIVKCNYADTSGGLITSIDITANT